MPIDSIGLFSFVSYSWVSNYMYKAHKKGITMDEIPAMSSYDECNYNADRCFCLLPFFSTLLNPVAVHLEVSNTHRARIMAL